MDTGSDTTTHGVPIEALDLSRRIYNSLKRAGINYVEELVSLPPEGLLSIRNVGEMSVAEIEGALSDFRYTDHLPERDQTRERREAHKATPREFPSALQHEGRWKDTQTAKILQRYGIEWKPTEWSVTYFLECFDSWQSVSDLQRELEQASLPSLDGFPDVALVGAETLEFLLGIGCPLHRIPFMRAVGDRTTRLKLDRAGIATVVDLCLTAPTTIDGLGINYEDLVADLEYYLEWLASQAAWEVEVIGSRPSPVILPKLRGVSLYGLMRESFSHRPERDWEIFKKRYGFNGDERWTLQELGDEYGLTRERVRQIVLRGEKELVERIRGDELLWAFLIVCSEVISDAGVIQADSLVDELVELLELDPTATLSILVILVTATETAHYYHPLNVFMSPDFPRDELWQTQAALKERLVKARAPIRRSDLEEYITQGLDVGDRQFDRKQHLARLVLRLDPEFIRVEEDYWGLASWDKHIVDDIVMALRSTGKPTHFKELTRLVNQRLPGDQQATSRAIHASLGRYDGLFARTGPGAFALREWDQDLPVQPPRYRDLIKQVLEDVGIPLTTEEIFQRVHELRPANRNSIAMYVTMHEDFAQFGKNRFGLSHWIKEKSEGMRQQARLSEQFLDELRVEALKTLQAHEEKESGKP